MNIPQQPPQGEVVGSVAKMLARAAPILARLNDLRAQRPLVVEVGVSSGIMAEHLLQQHPGLEWHGIDAWAPAEQQRQCYVESGDVHAVLSAEHAEHGMAIALRRIARFAGRAHVHRDWSPEAAEGFASGSAHMVFLDADHSHAGVLADCRAWWRVIAPGGWLGGHDWRNQDPRFNFGVEAAVMEWLAEAGAGLELELDQGLTWFVRKP